MADSEYVAALKREREHYERYGMADRLKAVDDEIKRAGRASRGGDAETAVVSDPAVEKAVPKGRGRK